tara:strand:- start:605 stop:1267 length:663 start_codon:yes stop_codon:yes gene_type:complete
MLRSTLLIFYCLSYIFSYAQGDKNLYKQYRSGPDPDGFYHKWNYSINTRINWMNSDQDYTKNGIGKGFGLLIQKLNSKTFGWSSGIEFNEIQYAYDGYLENSTDKVNWISFPLSIRLYPTRKLLLEAGFKYHYFLNAKNSIVKSPLTNSLKYSDESFGNTFGTFITVQYQAWKRINTGLQYQYLKGKNINPSGIQPSIFSGISLRLSYFFKNPLKRPISN